MKPIWYKPIFFFFLKKCFNLFDTCRVRVFACWTRRFFCSILFFDLFPTKKTIGSGGSCPRQDFVSLTFQSFSQNKNFQVTKLSAEWNVFTCLNNTNPFDLKPIQCCHSFRFYLDVNRSVGLTIFYFGAVAAVAASFWTFKFLFDSQKKHLKTE